RNERVPFFLAEGAGAAPQTARAGRSAVPTKGYRLGRAGSRPCRDRSGRRERRPRGTAVGPDRRPGSLRTGPVPAKAKIRVRSHRRTARGGRPPDGGAAGSDAGGAPPQPAAGEAQIAPAGRVESRPGSRTGGTGWGFVPRRLESAARRSAQFFLT